MADNTNKKLLERERIIFLQGIKEKDAIDLSNKYPNLVIFSNGDKFSDVWTDSVDNSGSYTDQFYEENDSIKYDTDTILGCSIIKNGVSYTIVKGIHPKRNCIKLKIGEDNERNLRIYLDKNGLINFIYGDYEIKFNDRGTIIQTKYIADGDTLGNLPTPERIYTITWDPNGGNITSGNNISEIKWWWEKNENNTENSNYWVTPSTSTDKITTITPPEEDTTYYAHWGTAPNYTLDSIKPTVEKQYYTFNKWTYNGANYQNINVGNINEDRTYIAQWTLNNYYWYVGNVIQQNTSTITVATGTNPGWRKINNIPNSYTNSNPLWDGINNHIQTGYTTEGCYLYIPKDYVDGGLGVYDGLGVQALDNLYQKTSRQTININSIVYYEYLLSGICSQFDLMIYKK